MASEQVYLTNHTVSPIQLVYPHGKAPLKVDGRVKASYTIDPGYTVKVPKELIEYYRGSKVIEGMLDKGRLKLNKSAPRKEPEYLRKDTSDLTRPEELQETATAQDGKVKHTVSAVEEGPDASAVDDGPEEA